MICIRMLAAAVGGCFLLGVPLAAGSQPDETSTSGAAPESVETLADQAPAFRDPFWPVGWRPPPPVPEHQDEEDSFDPHAVDWPPLRLRGISRAQDGRALAIVEGVGLVEAGDIISLARDGLLFRWRITRIDSGGMVSVRLDVRPMDETRNDRR